MKQFFPRPDDFSSSQPALSVFLRDRTALPFSSGDDFVLLCLWQGAIKCNGSGKKNEREAESARCYDGEGCCMLEIGSASEDEDGWSTGEPFEEGMYGILAAMMITRSVGSFID